MNIVVLVKLVPDLVEELEIDAGGKSLDMTFMRQIINEPDEHALEQALLLKESSGAEVTVIGLGTEGMDDVLFTAAAKGADHEIRLTGSVDTPINNHALARAYASVLGALNPGLILTGVQANNDLDGALGPILAELMELPYVGYISGVALGDGSCTVRKEYAGGLIGEMEVVLPAVLGIQAAESPPRYVAVSKVRQAMKTMSLEEMPAPELDTQGGVDVERMVLPEGGEHAEMIEGDIDAIADRLISLLRDHGVL
jgi:electron transfer flavoprotein beta subunit